MTNEPDQASTARIRTVNRLAVEGARAGRMPNAWMLQAARRSKDSQIVAECLLTVATAFACSGHPIEARAVLADVTGLVTVDVVLEPYWSWRYQNVSGIVADDFADLDLTWQHHRRSLDVALETGVPLLIATSRYNLGYVALQAGMHGEALVSLTEILGMTDLSPDILDDTHHMLSRLFHEQSDQDLALEYRQLTEHRKRGFSSFAHGRLLSDMSALAADLYDIRWLDDHKRGLWSMSIASGSELARLEAGLYEAKIRFAVGHTEDAISRASSIIDRCPEGLAIKPTAILVLVGFLVVDGQFDRARVLLEGPTLQAPPAVFAHRVAVLSSVVYEALAQWQTAAVFIVEAEELSRARTQDFLRVVELQTAANETSLIARQNEILELQNQRIKELSDDKEAIMNVVAHDLQSPLTALQLVLQLLRSDPPEIIGQHLEMALRALDRIDASVGQLSLVGEIKAGVTSLDYRQFSFRDLLDRVEGVVRYAFVARSVRCIMTTDIECDIECDETRIEQLLQFLLIGFCELSVPGDSLALVASISGSQLEVRLNLPGLETSVESFRWLCANWSANSPDASEPAGRPNLPFYISTQLGLVLDGSLEFVSLSKGGAELSIDIPISLDAQAGADYDSQ